MSYNTRNPAVKRLMREALELREPTELYHAKPLEDNLFEWHFTIRGPGDTDFEGGIYHGRIILPTDYPMKPPNILLLTANGRFEVNRKICLSISGYHPETWRPSWSIRTALLAIIGFMPSHGVGAIGSLDYPPEQRKRLAKESVNYCCPECGSVANILQPLTQASKKDAEEAQSLASQITFHEPKPEKANKESEGSVSSSTDVKDDKVETTSTTSANPSQTSASTISPATGSVPQMPPVASPWWMMHPMAMGMRTPSPFQGQAFPSQQPLSFVEWLEQVKRVQVANMADAGIQSVPSSSSSTTASVFQPNATTSLINENIESPATSNEDSVRQRVNIASAPQISSYRPSTSGPSISHVSMPVIVPPPPMSPIDRLIQLSGLIILLVIFYIIVRNLLTF